MLSVIDGTTLGVLSATGILLLLQSYFIISSSKSPVVYQTFEYRHVRGFSYASVMELNVIAGLPRSGSTLLCNILNQNPNIYASSTSILPLLVSNVINTWSNSIENKSDLDRNRIEAEDRMHKSLRSFCESWYGHSQGKVTFDKSRGWNTNVLALRALYPQSKVIVPVRDLRNVFASVEKQHRKNPLLDSAAKPTDKTLFERASQLFSPNGLIGSSIAGVEDMIRRRLDVHWVKFETFVNDPETGMNGIYHYLKQTPFKHDFDNVENTATDPDAYFNFKFPHRGEGKVRPANSNEWRKFMNDEMAATIMGRFPLYNNFFGYQ